MKGVRKLLLVSVGCVSIGAAVHAEEIDQTAARFAALASVQDISLSPSGRHIAVVQPSPGGQTIMVADMQAAQVALKPIQRNTDSNVSISWCDWPSDTRLICNIIVQTKIDNLTPVYASRLVIMNSDGSDSQVLTASRDAYARGVNQHGGSIISWPTAERPDSILISREFLPSDHVGSRLGSTDEGLGAELVDLENLRRTTVERGSAKTEMLLADEHGQIRLKQTRDSSSSGYLKDSTHLFYRADERRSWEALEPRGIEGEFNPVAVDSGKNVVYGFAEKDGMSALYTVSLDGSGKTDLVYSRPDAEVNRVVRLGPGGRVVGASYATDRRVSEFFDPKLKALRKALGDALPGHPSITFADASADESKMLLIASSDVDPGSVFLFDKGAGRLETVLPLRELLIDVPMSEMQAISYPAADGTTVPAYLTLPKGGAKKGLPAIVMPHGGPSARDEWGFDWLVQYFASKGYAVLQPNYRGSSGYGSGWMGQNAFRAWDTAISDVNDAGKWLVDQGIAAPDKLAIVGWSYGGYAALQSQVVSPDLYKAVIAVAPVTDLEMIREEARNYTNYRLVDAFVGRGPHIEAGSPARHADRFSAPVLMFHGDQDKNVGINQARKMDRELRKSGKETQLVEFEGLDHYLETNKARYDLLTKSDAFLRKNLGLKP
ncbi:alpha/beta hydrolase family protein [Qipengyuania sp.]|uniref:alpha/beta hydrolase family protein n=1 Tax=Qipengyuania sp. TaxID=2004515 RepID=UPI0035C78F7B